MTLEKLAVAASEISHSRHRVWDSLWQRKAIGRLAVAVSPTEESHARAASDLLELRLEPADITPSSRAEKWQEALLWSLYDLSASAHLPGDGLLALAVPRFTHGQSQGICDLFGAHVEEQPDGNFYVFPLPADPALIDEVQPGPPEESSYWGAVEYLRYARTATEGRFPFRMPVMTGPLDTANYLLGSTTLMEWLLTRPATMHRLLDKIVVVEVAFLRALQEAAGGLLHPNAPVCTGGGFDLCSECRSLVSRETYEEFEAPRLRRLGDLLGPYAIHSCGNWERTVPSALADPNLRVMNGQSKENDVATLCQLADGRLTLSIAPSACLAERYLWPDFESFLAHVLDVVPPTQPFEIRLSETDLPLWNRLCQDRGLHSHTLHAGT